MPTTEGSPASIGKSVQVHGEVKGNEDLVVDGTIEGTITLNDSRLTIGPNARVEANVAARDVIIIGSLTGDVNATGRVELRSGSALKGDIRAARLSIEENAVFSGKVDLSSASERGSNTRGTPVTTTTVPGSAPPSGALFGTAH